MKKSTISLGVGAVPAVLATRAVADDWRGAPWRAQSFERIATLPVFRNNPDSDRATVAEIVAADASGKTLVYTDAVQGVIGFVDISIPYWPFPLGTLDVGGSPTSVAVLGNRYVLAAVDTSESFTNPSGHLLVLELRTRQVVSKLDLGGQPDSIAISGDNRYAAVIIENQRDEEREVGGNEGALPQLPSGELMIVDLRGWNPELWTIRRADLTGLSLYAPEDAEPEFVDINEDNEAVVTLQENNHVAVVDLQTGKVVDDFSAGSVDLVDVDVEEDGLIALTGELDDVPREPDAVAWIPGGTRSGGNGWSSWFRSYGKRSHARNLIATANEGDWEGGSRGFSIFDRDGNVLFDSGNELEHLAVRHGHYPESRSENKGTEPEAIEYARFGSKDYLFVGSERGSFVAVYELVSEGKPELVQLLPAPMGPEGLLAIPQRDLLVVTGEEDRVPDDDPLGLRSTIMIYRLDYGTPAYPGVVSANDLDGKPIPWSALSGLAAVPGRPDRLLGVSDSYYDPSYVFEIDVSQHPAVIDKALAINGADNLDGEGLAVAPDSTYWVASEGAAGADARRNRLIQIDAFGNVLRVEQLPAEVEACRAASTIRNTLGSGFEGVTVLPKEGGGYRLAVVQQRGWNYTTPTCEALDDNPASDENDAEPRFTRIWVYDPQVSSWDSFAYELEPLPEDAAWVGLSEITRVHDSLIVIERDNRSGEFAELKTLVKFPLSAVEDGVVLRSEKRTFDLLPALNSTNGWISDKAEGVAVAEDGNVYLVTDNDGVEDWSGETSFLRLGKLSKLFR